MSLPKGWCSKVHVSGIPFYVQTDTNVVSWSRPYYCSMKVDIQSHHPELSVFHIDSDTIGSTKVSTEKSSVTSTEKPTSSISTEKPSITSIEKPTGSISIEQPSVTSIEKPSITSTEKPTGNNTSTEKPTGSNTSTEKPTGSNTSTEKPTGSITSTEKNEISATGSDHHEETKNDDGIEVRKFTYNDISFKYFGSMDAVSFLRCYLKSIGLIPTLAYGTENGNTRCTVRWGHCATSALAENVYVAQDKACEAALEELMPGYYRSILLKERATKRPRLDEDVHEEAHSRKMVEEERKKDAEDSEVEIVENEDVQLLRVEARKSVRQCDYKRLAVDDEMIVKMAKCGLPGYEHPNTLLYQYCSKHKGLSIHHNVELVHNFHKVFQCITTMGKFVGKASAATKKLAKARGSQLVLAQLFPKLKYYHELVTRITHIPSASSLKKRKSPPPSSSKKQQTPSSLKKHQTNSKAKQTPSSSRKKPRNAKRELNTTPAFSIGLGSSNFTSHSTPALDKLKKSFDHFYPY